MVRTIAKGMPLVILTLIITAGCAFFRGTYGDDFDDKTIGAIKKGIATREEVAARLGAPDRIVEANGREIFHYYRYDVKVAAVVAFSRTNVMSDNLYIVFSHNGIVDDVIYGKRTGKLQFQWWPFDE
ncbi:MAG: hypothetical protein HZB35_12160 [Nitrospirae bacterium]|nr:hypothetical protein [Nitrospirota bacterium]